MVAIDPVRVLAGLMVGVLLALLAAFMIARLKRRPGGTPAWLTRFASAGPAADEIRILETRRASPHADVCLIGWGGKTYLVAVTPGGAALLDTRSEPSAPLPGTPGSTA